MLVSDNCIIRQCYNEIYTDCEKFGQKNWAYAIKTLLSKLGYLEIWHKQKIDRTFLAILKQRIYDQTKQEIYVNIENSKKYSFYRYLIYGFNIQYYLRKSIPMNYQKCMQQRATFSLHRVF